MNRTIIAVTTLVAVSIGHQANAANVFYFTSSPTSWVGHGLTQTMTLTNGYSFSSHRYFSQGAYTNDLSFGVTKSSDWWDLDFVGGSNTLVSAGLYADALRYPFNGTHPGLSFIGNGRGDNRLTGWFNVLEAVFDSGGQVQRFAADFTQYDEQNTSRWNFGSFRYNSDVPITTIPEPSTLALGMIALAALSMHRCK